MSAMELFWYVLVGGGTALALADWRKAIYFGLVIDVLRDPVRKLVPDQPVLVTISAAGMWLVIVFMGGLNQRASIRHLLRMYPQLKSAIKLGLVALIPAAVLATVNFRRGWLMAGIGGASYLIPAIGIAAGFTFLRRQEDVRRLMVWYIFTNAIALVSVPVEYAGLNVPALGGIDYDWIRYHEDTIVDLMCGWYRSPDVMGLHAAQVVMMSVLLIVLVRRGRGSVWAFPAVFAFFALFLSGRRKMIGIPLVFIAAFVALGLLYRLTKLSRLAGTIVVTAALSMATAIFVWSPDEASEHSDFAATLVTQGVERSQEIVFSSVQETLRQSGILGAGLGAATQGRYYAGTGGGENTGWQEDGVSRLLLEFGVPGVLCLLAAGVLMIRSIQVALKSVPRNSDWALLQIGLFSIVMGNAASFAVSHQQFSGDPVNSLVVTLFVGMILKLPSITVSDQGINVRRG